jgi:hypothetical protein
MVDEKKKRILINEKNIILEEVEGSICAYRQQLEILIKTNNEWKKDKLKEDKETGLGNKLIESFTKEDINNQFLQFGNILEERLSKSIVMSLYGFMEYSLFRLCKKFEEILEIELKIKDVYGRGMQQLLRYLECIGIKNVRRNKYKNLVAWNKVRNYLTHNDGIIEKSIPQKYISLMRNVVDIEFNDILDIYDIIIDFKCASKFIDDVQAYISYIFNLDFNNLKNV